MHAPHAPEQGFTLIETMIALAIFAIGSMGILAILTNGFGTTAESNNLTGGYEMAQNAIGMIRANGGNALQFNGAVVSKTGSVTMPGSANTVVVQAINSWKNMLHPAALPPLLPAASGQIAIVPLQGSGMCPCAATISVGWLSSNGIPETYTVQTIVGY